MEQSIITFVRFNVVNDGCGYYLFALEVEFAQRLLLELMIAKAIPALSVVKVMPRRIR